MEFFVSSEVSYDLDLSGELMSILRLPEAILVIWSDKWSFCSRMTLDDVMVLFRWDKTCDSESDFFWHRFLKRDIFDGDTFFGFCLSPLRSRSLGRNIVSIGWSIVPTSR
jgi:hypothetical protein